MNKKKLYLVKLIGIIWIISFLSACENFPTKSCGSCGCNKLVGLDKNIKAKDS